MLSNFLIKINNVIPYILEEQSWFSQQTTAIGSLITGIWRVFIGAINQMMVWLIDASYDFIMLLADTNVFGDEVIALVSTRIYALVAIFMLFKLSITLIKYLSDPDSFDAKDTGFGKLINKAILALVLLALMPFIFQQAYQFQSLVLRNQVMERLVFGRAEYIGEDQGRFLSFATTGSFIYPDPAIVGDSCKSTQFSASNITSECREALRNAVGGGEETSEAEEVINIYNYAITNQNAELLLSPILVQTNTVDGHPVFKFYWFWSPIALLLVALLMISFCFDIAIRAVKLGFLQLIAPIPILASIDPKSDMLQKWFTTVVQTFADLFLRLLAVFFAVFVISVVFSDYGGVRHSTGETITDNSILTFMIIIGSLLFAKQLPELITNITGAKFDSGGFSLNPFNRLRQTPILGKAYGAGTGMIGGGIGGWFAGRASGTSTRGMVHGAFVGLGAGSSKTAWGGAKASEVEPHTMMHGMQQAYKNYTGDEKAILSTEKIVAGLSQKKAEEKMAPSKAKIKQLKQAQFHLDQVIELKRAERSKLYEERANYTPGEFAAKDQQLYGEITEINNEIYNAKKMESVYDDKIKDVKTAFKYDDSSKSSLYETDEKFNDFTERIARRYDYNPRSSGDNENSSPSPPPSSGGRPSGPSGAPSGGSRPSGPTPPSGSRPSGPTPPSGSRPSGPAPSGGNINKPKFDPNAGKTNFSKEVKNRKDI